MAQLDAAFNDPELTILAHQIVQDLNSNANLDPTDSDIDDHIFKFHMTNLSNMAQINGSFNDQELTKLAEQIIQDTKMNQNLYPTESDTYTDTYNYPYSANSDDNMVKVSLPAAPIIISQSQSLASDSFYKPLPATHGNLYNDQSFLPRLPPSISIEAENILIEISSPTSSNAISSAMSPRCRRRKRADSEIPDFSDFACGKTQKKKKKRKRKKKKCAAYRTRRVLSPIHIGFVELKIKGTMTPTRYSQKKQMEKRKAFKERSDSVAWKYNEFAVELDDVLMFVNKENM